MKLTVVLAVLIGAFVLACSGGVPAPTETIAETGKASKSVRQSTPSAPTSVPTRTSQPTPIPAIRTSEQEEPSCEYIGCTHAPVDFTQT